MRDRINMLGMLDIKGDEQTRRVYSPDGIAPTLNTMQGGNRQPKVLVKAINDQDGLARTIKAQYAKSSVAKFATGGTFGATGVIAIKQATKQGYIEAELPAVVDLNYPSSSTRRGRVQDGGKVCPTLTTENQPSVIENEYRIRKLTPRECWRLMGFTDEDFNKASECNSNSQLYKQAGNSIVVNCLEEIFKQLL